MELYTMEDFTGGSEPEPEVTRGKIRWVGYYKIILP